MTTYPVHERFHSFQGEGLHMGRSAFFIRLFGCPIHCPWCDSAGTWHPQYVPKDIPKLSIKELVSEASEAVDPAFVVITGGEPAVFDLLPLTNALHNEGLIIHLETSGAFPIQGNFDWITLSPKKWRTPLPINVELADEFKIIAETPYDITLYLNMLRSLGLSDPTTPVWLHPEWSHRNDPDVLKAITEVVKANLGNCRAGYQIHKLYSADSTDARSRPLVPLGGNPEKGT